MSVYQRAYEEREGSIFAEYLDLTVEYRDASHRYWLHKDGARTPAVSVTSALKVLDKPALISWAERCGAEGAARLADMGELDNVPPEEAINLVRLHKLGVDAKRDAGADRGTALHDVQELWVTEGKTPKLGDFAPEVRGYVQAYSLFLVTREPEPVEVEVIVGSVKHGYAGRLDMIANLDGRRILLDLKSSPTARVYPEAHVQTQAYCTALPECGIEEVEGALIVAIGADGTFATSECCAEEGEWLSILGAYRAMTRLRAAVGAQERLARAVA